MSTVSYTVTTRFDGVSGLIDRLPAGRLVRVEASVLLPAAATRNEILEWVKFSLGWGSLALDNPLSDHDLEVSEEPTLTDTGYTSDRLLKRAEAMRAHDAHSDGGESGT